MRSDGGGRIMMSRGCWSGRDREVVRKDGD